MVKNETIGEAVASLFDGAILSNLGTDHEALVVQLASSGGNGIPWFGGMHCIDIETYPNLTSALVAVDRFATMPAICTIALADVQRELKFMARIADDLRFSHMT